MANKKNTSNRRDADELEVSYRKVAKSKYKGKYASKKKAANKGRTGAIVAICFTVLLVIGLIIGAFWFINSGLLQPDSGAFYVAGVDISGMSSEDAAQAIKKATATTYSRQSLMIQLGEDTIELTPAVSGVRLDVDSLMEAIDQLEERSGEFDVSPYLALDEEAIRKILQDYADTHESQLTQPVWALEGDPVALTEEDPGDPQVLKITMGTPQCHVDVEMLYQQIVQCFNTNTFQLTYDCGYELPAEIDLALIEQEFCQEVTDAQMDMETFEVSDHSYGYTFDTEYARELLSQASYGDILEIPMELIKPEHTKEELSSVLFRDVLGTYTAVQPSQGGRDVNLKLSCEAINGIVLMPGEVFSYDQTLGERTPEKGYKMAAGYEGMKTVQTYGGGICQASSALYYCALIADIEIVQRHSHTFISAYMPFGMDATVSWKGPDLKIKNTTEYPIRIEAFANEGTVVVSLIGTDTKDYYVVMEYEINAYDPYATVYEEYAPDNEEGYKDGQVICTPYDGYTITTYKCKYDKETDELISRTKEVRSVYERRDYTIAKIVDPNAPEPSEPEDDPSDPSDPSEPSEPTDPSGPPPIEEDG